jgi:hypothetical protein
MEGGPAVFQLVTASDLMVLYQLSYRPFVGSYLVEAI